jgi:transcription elongation factor Elf1
VIENSSGSTETEVLICPICGTSIQSISSNDNNAINAHIDACLNAKTVKQLAQEETLYADLKGGKPKKKRSLADFFNT